MKRTLLSLLLLIISSFVFSQSIITGHLSSKKNKSVEGIIVSLHQNTESKNFLAFCVSDPKGFFKLKYSGDIENKNLRVRSLMYRDTSLLMLNGRKEYNLRLVDEIQKLKEVSVRSTPIFTKGDTTTYITGAFAKKQDFSIGEVIGHMPGFELATNSKVYYQGREIEKYYIEGSDLLGRRYSLANKNLPHKAVASVLVLHNHQSKKLFANKISSDQTSINIKLKKSVAVTGRGEIGTAYKPLGRFLNLTPMLFSKKYQFIGSVQSNNIGDDLNSNFSVFTFKNGRIMGKERMRFKFLGLPSLYYPKVDKRRYLDNDANFVSLNTLRKLNNESELKINAGYISDNVNENKKNKTTYYLDNDLYSTKENQHNKFNKKSLYADFNLKKNLSSIYFNNKLGYIQFWDKSKAIIQGDKNQIIEARSPHRSIYNVLDCTIPFGNTFASIYSSIDLNQSDEDLFFKPSVFSNILNYGDNVAVTRQNLKNESLISNNYLEFAHRIKPFILETKLGFDYENQTLKTSMFANNELLQYNFLKNSIAWNRSDYRLEPCLKYETAKLKISLNLPLRFYSLSFNDNEYKSKFNKNEFLYTTSFYLNYDWTSFLTSRINLSRSESIGDPNKMLQGNVVYDHRTMRSRLAEIDGSNNKSINLEFNYRNIISGVFARLNYIKKQRTKDFILDKDILEPGVFSYKLLQKENLSSSDQISAEMSYHWFNTHLNFNLKSMYAHQKSEYLLSESLKTFKVDIYSNKLKVNFDKWQFLAIDYDYSLDISKQNSNGNHTKTVEQTHKARICYYIDFRQWLEIKPELSIMQHTNKKTQEAMFTDLIYSYTPKGSRFSYMV